MIGFNLGATNCPNMCRHCWIYGGDTHQRETIPEDVLWKILDRFRRHDSERFDLGLGQEGTYHPHFIDFYELVNRTPNFEKIIAVPTNGWGIAREPDAASRMKEAGIKYLRFTLYGEESTHDWFAQRKGAYADIITAADRAKAAGIRVSWNIKLCRANLGEIPGVLAMIQRREEKYTPFVIEPTGRGAEIGHLALNLSDYAQLPEEIGKMCELTDLSSIKCYGCLKTPSFHLTPDLDVHFDVMFSGSFRRCAGSRLGNLEESTILEIVARLEENKLYRLLTSMPVQELAQMYGQPDDARFHSCYLHRKWLGSYFRERGVRTDFLEP